MARAWITDLWVKGRAQVPAAQLKNIKKLDPEYQSAKYGRGRRWQVQWRDPEKKLKSKTFDVKAAAEAYAAELEDDHRSGRYLDPKAGEVRFHVVAEQWLAGKRKVKDATRSTYRVYLDSRILPHWGNLKIDSITENTVTDWLELLEAEKLSSSYTSDLVKVVRSVLTLAVRQRLIAINPAVGVETARVVNKDRAYLSAEEVDALTEGARHVEGEAMATMILTMAYTGLRIGEAVALRIGDVDLTTGRIHVTRTLTNGDQEGTPKGGKSRRVPIPSFLTSEIKPLQEGRSEDAYLFTNSQGGRLNLSNWRNRTFAGAIHAAGLEIPNLTPHSLRHTYASLSIKAGVDVVTLQAAMGHAKATETLNTYSHLWPERLDDLAVALENVRRP